jgi:hypothetical protein
MRFIAIGLAVMVAPVMIASAVAFNNSSNQQMANVERAKAIENIGKDVLANHYLIAHDVADPVVGTRLKLGKGGGSGDTSTVLFPKTGLYGHLVFDPNENLYRVEKIYSEKEVNSAISKLKEQAK